MDNTTELFERISDEYSMILLNWAYKKTGSRTDAEDLAQEVLAQVFRSAKKEQHIEKLDNFIWKIAHFVWCNYLKENIVLRACVSIDSFDYDLLSEKDHTEKYFEAEEMNANIRKMRFKISNLNYLQREIMIMHYIDELPVKTISKKLNITEAAVKWHLYDTRKKLNKEINEMNNTDFVYRPGILHMGGSGNSGPNCNTQKINESLTKQNICLACYREPKTPAELSEMLGIAQAYIEFDLKWLVNMQFMKNENGKYYTMFSISDRDSYTKTANLFLKNKENFADVIIKKFTEKKDKIQNIGFYGSDQFIEKLLWLFIYRFIDFVDYKVTYEENKYPMPERPIMPDGGQYFPLGFNQNWNVFDIINDAQDCLNEKYRKIVGWNCNGAMQSHTPNGEIIHWIGLYNAGQHSLTKISCPSVDNYQFRQIFSKTLNKNFSTDELNDDEKEILGEMISDRWVSKKGDKIIHNFSVFTYEQNKALENIFTEIYEEMKKEIYDIFDDIEKLCQANLPKHLGFYINYHIYMTFYNAIALTTGFAYYDGKLYDPKDDVECGLLTLQVITG